ncbi:family A1 protease [Cerioporus squamosus]|nr:family A1 protease [Cerioporus squamosus]
MLAKLRLFSAVVLALTLPLLAAAFVVDRDAARITLPVLKRVNMTGNAKLAEVDQARARALRARVEDRYQAESPSADPVDNTAVSYLAAVGVGSPPKTFNLIVDTGSSNTWVGAQENPSYNPHGKLPQGTVLVSYGSGFFFGKEYSDEVTLTPDLAISNQSIGDATYAYGFNIGTDGILGLGPSGLTCGTVTTLPPTDGCEPTVTDNAFTQGLINAQLVGISFAPTTNLSDTNGELTFGSIDQTKYTGSLDYVPITSTSPASKYVGIDQKITHGSNDTPILNLTSGIVDTGTTLIILATGDPNDFLTAGYDSNHSAADAFKAYQAATGATPDTTTGLLKITKTQYESLQSLFFHIGDKTYELTANGQIWPRALNAAIGGQSQDIYLVFADMGSSSGTGLDFILGQTWLERFFHVYDSGNNRAGFATSPFTKATSN